MTDLKHNFWSVKSWVKDVLLLKKHKKIILLEKEKTSQIFIENSELIVSICNYLFSIFYTCNHVHNLVQMLLPFHMKRYHG